MNTVNVVEIPDEQNSIQIRAFPETPEGNKEAENLFKQLITENWPIGYDLTDREIASYIADGYFSYEDYWVGLVHSSN